MNKQTVKEDAARKARLERLSASAYQSLTLRTDKSVFREIVSASRCSARIYD
jgi:hypothetical protein